MSTYMLACLKLEFGVGNLVRYNEAMKSIREFFEDEGVMLQHAFITSVGPVCEAWNLWKIDDHAHWERAMARGNDERVYAKYEDVLNTMQEVVAEENVSLLDTMPFFMESPPASGA